MNTKLTREDMIRLGRVGGMKRTPKQTKARQKNGRKGGRPKGTCGFDFIP